MSKHENVPDNKVLRDVHGRPSDTPSKSTSYTAVPPATAAAAAGQQKDNASAKASSPFVASTTTTTSSSLSSPVIFVGFGAGANALLHLASSYLLLPSSGCGVVDIVSDGAATCSRMDVANDGNDRRDVDHDGKSSGRLALALHRNALHVGGLVLVNGFVSLDKQSAQVRALAILFLSTHYVA